MVYNDISKRSFESWGNPMKKTNQKTKPKIDPKTAKKPPKNDDLLFRGENLYEGIFGFLGLLIIGIGKFMVFTAVLMIGMASAILGLGFLVSMPPLGLVCITPLLILIFGKKEFLKRFM